MPRSWSVPLLVNGGPGVTCTRWGVSGDGTGQVACLACDLTGDLVYAACCQGQLEGTCRRRVEPCRHFADWRFPWLCFGSCVPRPTATVAAAPHPPLAPGASP